MVIVVSDAHERSRRTRGTGSYAAVFRALARKRAMLLVRYPANTLSMLAMTFAFFAMIFFGGRAMAGQALSDSLGGIIVGYFLWTMAVTAFSGLAWNVTRESQWGTLEQLYMSPFGYGRVMVAEIVVRLLESFLWGAVTLVFMLLLTGESIRFPVATVAVATPLALAPAVGIGFAFAGLALLYKRVENAFNVLQFAFIGLIAAPSIGSAWTRVLPLSQGSYVLARAMQDGVALWELPAVDLALLGGTAAVYLGLGYGAFVYASHRARRAGLMGKY